MPRDATRVRASRTGEGYASGCGAPASDLRPAGTASPPPSGRSSPSPPKGFTSRQIGDRLYISTFTVGSHLRHVCQKLGISSRLQLRGRGEAPPPVTSADPAP